MLINDANDEKKTHSPDSRWKTVQKIYILLVNI